MRDIPTSPRTIEIRRKRRIRKWRLGILYVILFFCIILALSFLSSEKHVVIDKVDVVGAHIISPKSIESEVFNYLSGKYLHLFARNNSFIYPHNKIYNQLLIDFPRIKSLSIKRDNVKTLRIEITERIGSSLYCGESIPTNIYDVGENCYFINNDGLIFDTAPYFSGNVYFKYYMKIGDNNSNPLSKQMMDVDKFHKLSRLIDEVYSMDLKPIYLYRDSDGVDYLYLDHIQDHTSPKIIFKDSDDFDIIEENLSIAMSKKEFADEIHSRYNTLLYIDLRFKNKVLYKFQ